MSLPRVKQRGFTLIELLLVMTILLLLLGMVSMASGTLTQQWNRLMLKSNSAFQQYKTIDLVRSALNSVVPFQVKDKSEQSGFYFLGRADGFTAVTESGVLNAGRLSVFRVFSEKQPDGKFSLFYEEAPLNTYPLVYAQQQHNFNFRLLLAKDLTQLNFAYYGWKDVQSYEEFMAQMTTVAQKEWKAEFDGMQLRLQPERLEIKLNNYSWLTTIPAQRAEFAAQRRGQADE